MKVTPTGQPTRLVAPALALVGTVAMTFWMANREPFPRGPLWGSLLALITSAAWVAWWVPASPEDGRPWRSTSLGKRDGEWMSPAAAAALGLAVLLATVWLGGYDWLPLGILLGLGCLVPSAMSRPGLAVMLVVSALYLPRLGVGGLWDPWETHYGEVAREILSRNDWISLWWAQDKWFWSKPILLFWMEALSMGVLGVDYLPDANPAHPEWALRLPAALMALAALAVMYRTTRQVFDARAGVLAVLVTATLPQFFFISHQAITDVPLVAAITIACCLLVLAIHEDDHRDAAGYQIGPWTLSLQHVVVFVLVLLVLPQVTYLISRNVSFLESYGWVAHPDRFLYGSAGNVDVPGNPAPRDQSPAVSGVLGQPFLQGLVWLGALVFALVRLRDERRARPLLMVSFYVACALAFMAKGLPGIAIPGAAALFYLVASGRWRLLGDGALRVSLGVLVVFIVSLPWYVAMYVRHGSAFTNRLLIHDHINRLAAGVHGDKGGIDYFVTQIGYAMFPWVAFVPLVALAFGRARSRGMVDERSQTMLFLGAWLLSSFVLFSAMVTKFHHYILPAIVPAAMLIAIALAETWGPNRARATWLAGAGGAFTALGCAWLFGDPRGVVPAGAGADWVLTRGAHWLGYLAVGGGALSIAAARRDLDRGETHVTESSWSTAVGVALALGAVALAFVGRDLSWATSARPQGNERLIHLFVYNYARAWPEHLDYRALLSGFAVAATVLVAMAAFWRWRAAALRGVAGVAVAFCAWGLNIYMVDVADHWSARDLTDRYYAARESSDVPLIAWQMNWKGENFYTGNRVYVFAETDNKRIKKWIAGNEGRRVFVLLEHKRLSRFKKLVPGRTIEPLSTKRDNNKFLLVTLEI